jgi:hypothetical protein
LALLSPSLFAFFRGFPNTVMYLSHFAKFADIRKLVFKC